MAISKGNVLVKGMSGKFGNMLFRQRSGKTIVSPIPRHNTKYTEAQLMAKAQFGKAMAYARLVLSNPNRKKIYEDRVFADVNAMNLAVKDFLRPPVIEKLDTRNYDGLSGGQIIITATDDFMVASVQVEIWVNGETLLENGPANLDSGELWIYNTKTTINNFDGTLIKVTAQDLPGNFTTKELKLSF